MAQRARKYREIKKRVKAYMEELLKKDSERVNNAMESYLKNVTYQRNDTNNFYEVVENNNENVDSNNCHCYEDNMNDLRSESDDIDNYSEDMNNSFDS